MKQVEIYTDGACSGNPGPGGWGAVLRYRSPGGQVYEKERAGKWITLHRFIGNYPNNCANRSDPVP